MSYHNHITQLMQLAGVNYLGSVGMPGTIVPGLSRAPIASPQVVVICHRVVPSEMFEGNWSGNVRFELYSNIDETTEEEFHQLAGQLFSYLMVDEQSLPQLVNEAARTLGIILPDQFPVLEFTVQEIVPVAQGWEVLKADEKAGTARRWLAYMEQDWDGVCGSDLEL